MTDIEETMPALEQALIRTEAEADAALRAAGATTKTLKQVRAAVHAGNLRDLDATLATAAQSLATLAQQVDALRASWQFDADAYLASGAYTREVLAAAERLGVRIFEQDERLYAYPALVRVLPAERAVLVDRARERRLRPSVLVAHLRDLQRKPPRFKSDAFLEALFGAYRALAERQGKEALERGAVERLLDVYGLLTLLPGQAREYSRQEFARDVYLLDRSGVTETRGGYTVSFPASTGTKSPSGTLTVITESGQEQTYWGIAFARTG